jgi:hypothetical protein
MLAGMSRASLELEDLSGVDDAEFIKPLRIVLPNPRRGGPSVSEIRAMLSSKGKLRLSGTPASIFADLDPGEPEKPLIALETIVRSDAAGLERMLLTSLPHVDYIVLGIDGRSDEQTREVAEAYADFMFVFYAEALGMSAEAWEANKIDFPRARNIGRMIVNEAQVPWTLVVDSDEYVSEAPDLRAIVEKASDKIGSFSPTIDIAGSLYRDPQRLARTEYMWEKSEHGSHNQLVRTKPPEEISMVIVSDTRLRDRAEQQRRDAQRHEGIEDMVAAAAGGDLNALFHVAKHRAGGDDLAEAARLVEDYRLRCEVGSVLSEDRAWLALSMAFRYYEAGQMEEASRWACRALLDVPSVAALCVLGDVAEDCGRLQHALQWYQAACSMEETGKIKWPGLTELRFGRLAGIKRALLDPETAPTIASLIDV